MPQKNQTEEDDCDWMTDLISFATNARFSNEFNRIILVDSNKNEGEGRNATVVTKLRKKKEKLLQMSLWRENPYVMNMICMLFSLHSFLYSDIII